MPAEIFSPWCEGLPGQIPPERLWLPAGSLPRAMASLAWLQTTFRRSGRPAPRPRDHDRV